MCYNKAFFYMMVQLEVFIIVLLIAEWNTSITPSPDNAEHSMYPAPISFASLAPYFTNFCLISSLKSPLLLKLQLLPKKNLPQLV